MIRKDKFISTILALICSGIVSLIYFLAVDSMQDSFLLYFLAIPCFILFLSIFTSIPNILKKQNIRANISFLIQGFVGLIAWISLVLCFSDINIVLKDIALVTFIVFFIFFIISFGFTTAFENDKK